MAALDTCEFQTRLHARVPRIDCPTHGFLQSPVPWATPESKFTLRFERRVIDWLREAAVAAVARQLQLGWDAVWGIAQRAVARGLERRETLTLRYVGVDEKSFQRRHDYVTVVSDMDEGRVLFVADDRKQASLVLRNRGMVDPSDHSVSRGAGYASRVHAYVTPDFGSMATYQCESAAYSKNRTSAHSLGHHVGRPGRVDLGNGGASCTA